MHRTWALKTTRGRPSLGWLPALLLGLALAAGARAEGELDGEFAIRSASTEVRQGVVELSALVRYPLTDQIRAALQEGVTLSFDLDVVVSQPRRFWWNKDLLELDLRRELYYHAVSDRYVLTAEGAEQENFATVDAAIERLNELTHWPIMARAQLHGTGPWRVNVRAGVRRGRMPDALRTLIFWSDAWHRTTEWYSWDLEG